MAEYYQLDRSMTLINRLLKAKVLLQNSHPFFAYIVSHMKLIEAKKGELGGCPMGVSTKGEIYFDSEMIKDWTLDLIKGVLCHEAMHVALEHLKRGSKKDKQVWNIATDIAVNNMLIKNGLSLPIEGIIPRNDCVTLPTNPKIEICDIEEKSANHIYSEIMEQLPPPTKIVVSFSNGNKDEDEDKQQQQKISGFDKHIEVKIDDNKVSNSTEKDWGQIIVDAWLHSQDKGNTPYGVKRYVDKLLKPQINWKAQLQRFLSRTRIDGWDWSMPSKRSIAIGAYLPRLKRDGIELVVTVDTSGSISDKTLKAFLSEIIAIIKSRKGVKGTLLVGDCELKDIIPIENGNINKIKNMDFKGGGGTSHIPFYEWINKNKPTTKIVINLTDGYTEFPEGNLTRFRTLWVLTDKNVNVPFGSKIFIDEGGENNENVRIFKC